MPIGKSPGKLNGPNTATTPCGLNRVAAVVPEICRVDGCRRSPWASMVAVILWIIASVSVAASHRGLPVSRQMSIREIGVMLFELLAKCVQEFGSLGDVQARPLFKRLSRGDNSSIHLHLAVAACPSQFTSPLAGSVETKVGPSPLLQRPRMK